MPSPAALAPPLPYHPSVERPEPREADTAAKLRRMMRDIQESTLRCHGRATRGLHAKSHGLLEGELRVLDGLPPELAQGLFARPGTYPVVMRLSTNRGDILDDDISVPRGMAVKVIGVEGLGARLPGSEWHATQDFVMVDQPAFTEPDLRVFARNIRFVDLTTATGQAWKKALGAMLRPVVRAARALGGRAATLTTMGGHPLTHPLGEAFFSQVPFRYGDHVAKFCLAPVSPALAALKDRPVHLRGRPNGLREAVIAHLREHGGVWEFRVQLRTNARTMPIEDASAEWPEDESPYRAVARVEVAPQPAWTEARAAAVDDGLSFSPWHGLEAHRPLGSVNRARLESYAEAAAFRSAANGCPIHHPRARVALPSGPAQVYGTTRGREGRRPGTPDARRGRWGQPMRHGLRHFVAGAAGGLAGGLVLAAAEAAVAGPSRRHRRARLDPGGEVAAGAGRLALSAVAGAAWGVATRGGGAVPLAAWLGFGLGFGALDRRVVGPALGTAAARGRGGPGAGDLAREGAVYALCGVAAGLAAGAVARRL